MSKIEDSFEYRLATEQTIVFIIKSVMKEYVYKTKDINLFYDQVKEIVPVKADFFNNWFKAWVSIADFDFDTAANCYSSAFQQVSMAEEYVGQFIQQAFTFFMYTGNKKTALKFWDYGVSKRQGAPLDDNFFASFNPKEQFWTQFAPAMFIDQQKAREQAVKDYSKKIENKLASSIQNPDYKKYMASIKGLDLNHEKINGVSPLYFAIQTKGVISQGAQSYAEELAEFRTQQLVNSLNIEKMSDHKKQETIFTIRHNMKQMYVESGLGQVMFEAYYCQDSQITEATKNLDKIIAHLAESLQDVDGFKMNAGSAMSNTALFLAAELDDTQSCKTLLQKGASFDKPYGFAKFSFNTKEGTKSTEVPNTFIYRLIGFKSWNTLKMFLTDFSKEASPSMTAQNEKCNITPLVYLIMSMIYSASSESIFNQNKKIVDELLPLMQKCGASLEQNTAFGKAKALLGL